MKSLIVFATLAVLAAYVSGAAVEYDNEEAAAQEFVETRNRVLYRRNVQVNGVPGREVSADVSWSGNARVTRVNIVPLAGNNGAAARHSVVGGGFNSSRITIRIFSFVGRPLAVRAEIIGV